MNLIVSTTKNDEVNHFITKLEKEIEDCYIIDTTKMNIKGCMGCNHCWLITPGKCSIKDDYEKLLIQFLQADRVIFVTDTQLGFVSYQFKNIVDRILPLLTMHLRFKDGQMRHYLRYKKHYQMGLIYCGEGHHDFLQQWFSRVMLNLDGRSLGVYHISQKEDILYAFINN